MASFLDQFRAGTPGYNPQAQAPNAAAYGNLFDYQDPAAMGLLGAGAALLQSGQPSTTRQGLGGGIGSALMNYVQGQQGARRQNVLNALQGTQLSELLRQQTQRAQLSDAIKKGLADPNSQLAKTVPAGLAPLLANADPQAALGMIGQAAATQQQQGFSRETLALQQDFQAKQAEVQRAFAAAQQDNSFANQAKLQAAQQAFSAAEAALARAAQKDLQQAQIAAPLQPVPDPNQPGQMIPRAQAEAGAVSAGAFPEKAALAQLAANAKPMTDEQAKAAGFADRIRNAEAVLTDPAVVSAGQSLTERGRAAVPVVGNLMVSTEYQKFEQAQRDFINAVLRRESGAVISDAEFENAQKQYFPQPGDSKDVLAQKAKNRQSALQSLDRAAGPRYEPAPAAAPAPSMTLTKPMSSGWSIQRVQ